jgi:hypothetical protein
MIFEVLDPVSTFLSGYGLGAITSACVSDGLEVADVSETLLLVKRLPQGDFTGDRTWQVAPYALKDAAAAERCAQWLRRVGWRFEYRIVEAVNKEQRT